MVYAEVLLPLPIQGLFTYSVPQDLVGAVRPGHRVIVPFGKKKYYTGIVAGFVHKAPDGIEVKSIEQALDSQPIVRHPQILFWEWIADYYLCSVGDVYRAALPTGLKPESETFVELNSDFEESAEARLTEREAVILQTLDHADKKVSLTDLGKLFSQSAVAATVSRLIDRGAVRVSEKLVEKYHTRREVYVSIALSRGDSEALHHAFDMIKGAPKQEKAFMTLLELSGFMKTGRDLEEVSRKELLEHSGVTTAIVDALAKRGLVTLTRKAVSRFTPTIVKQTPLPKLSEAQSRALGEIYKTWEDHDITLLHGVTSSGKTELYITLIDAVLKQRRQVLYLVPEIALTTQLTERLQRVFGDKVIIYHSKFSDAERVEIWRRMLNENEPAVIVGARSSVFLPFGQLGLVIVDEEHEPSYKQQDPAPRYHGRDSAMVLARMHGAKTLLGSATPAIDTYYKAQSGRFGLVSLTTRYSDVPLPQIELIDMKQARSKRQVSGVISSRLRNLVNESIGKGDQAIIFLNRRGYAPVAQCDTCGYVAKCEHCDVSLTYHKNINRLCCHYCGATYELPPICPACKEPTVHIHGYGTERLHEELDDLFPDVGKLRLDLDTTRNKDSYQQIIDKFSTHQAQMLVGTQMVTKGLDFAGVSVVGVVNADSIIHYPDFRSSERAFNMLQQVSGRAGRRAETSGLVAIQTYEPENGIYAHLINHDYKGFYEGEIEERRNYNYPPFTRVIYIILRHRDDGVLDMASAEYARRLRELFGNRVSGPDSPSVSRAYSLHIRRIMLKVETEASMKKVKGYLRGLYDQILSEAQYRGLQIHYDVDPT